VKQKTWLWIVVAIILLALLGCCALTVMGMITSAIMGSAPVGGGAVAVIPVKGIIITGSGTGFAESGIAYSEDVVKDIEQAAQDPTISAIVLDINSPGGAVVGSADIYRALQESGKIVVASASETAASGGYYIACAARTFVVRPATITGSIGVITTATDVSELFDKLGIRQQIIKTGKFKDIGSLYRPLTNEEREILEDLIDDSYQDFVDVIVQGRDLEEGYVRELADGRIFSGVDAIELGLADQTGDLDDAIDLAAEYAGIEGEPRIVRYERPQSFFSTFGFQQPSSEMDLIERFLLEQPRLQIQYLYTSNGQSLGE
jgi:protease-4